MKLKENRTLEITDIKGMLEKTNKPLIKTTTNKIKRQENIDAINRS